MRSRPGAHRCPREREHRVHAERPEQRALAGHVRAGHHERSPRGRQRARRCPHAGRRPRADGRALAPRAAARATARATRRRGARTRSPPRLASASISPSASSQPRTCGPARAAPAQQRGCAVDVPHEQRPDEQPEDLVAPRVDEPHDALERGDLVAGLASVGAERFAQAHAAAAPRTAPSRWLRSSRASASRPAPAPRRPRAAA